MTRKTTLGIDPYITFEPKLAKPCTWPNQTTWETKLSIQALNWSLTKVCKSRTNWEPKLRAWFAFTKILQWIWGHALCTVEFCNSKITFVTKLIIWDLLLLRGFITLIFYRITMYFKNLFLFQLSLKVLYRD